MNEKSGRSNRATGVGSRVKVAVRGPGSGGVVIEDYADMVIDLESVGAIGLRCIGGRSHSMTED